MRVVSRTQQKKKVEGRSFEIVGSATLLG
jgi:hypothetical protein